MDLSLLDLLEQQHREAETLLKRMSSAEKPEEQRRLVDEFVRALREHMKIEENQVYPELAGLDGEMAEEAEIEHGLARKGLEQLVTMVGKPGFGAAVAMVQAGIEHHVEEEEEEAFPRLRKANGAAPQSLARASRKELYEQARELDIAGRSGMNRDELVTAVRKAQA